MLDAEWDFVSAALPRLLMGDNYRLQTVCDALWRFMDFSGRWDEFIWFSEQAESHALAVDNKEEAGCRAYQAGWMYNLRNQPAEVLACAARTTEHWQKSRPANKAYATRLRGIGHELNKDYSAAITAYREALEIHRSISPESDDVGVTLAGLTEVEFKSGNLEEAETDGKEALRIANIRNNQEGIANRTGNLADIALKREQWAEAESLAREALALAEKIGRQELIAHDSHSLAKALLKQNHNLDEALSMSRRAVEIFTRLRHPNLLSVQETLAEIEQARGGK